MGENAELMITAAQVVGIPGSEVVGVLNMARKALGFTTSEERMNQAIQEDWLDWVSENVIEWERWRQAWEEIPKQERPTATDVVNLLGQLRKVFEKTDNHGKRRHLRAALINAFNPELYQQGLTKRLLSTLERLEYGDVRALLHLANDHDEQEVAPMNDKQFAYHLKILVAVEAAVPRRTLTERHRLRVPPSITWYGRQLLRLLREPADRG